MLMNKSYNKFIEEASEVISSFPDLQLFSREDSLPYIEGDITLFDQNGESYDCYSIRIECSSDYPESFPLVYETADRLPHNIDWHVYNEGNFCICTPLEEYIHCAKGISLTTFVRDHVLPYLHNQSFRERKGYFVNERSHGTMGILESLFDLLKVNDRAKVINILIFIYRNDSPPRTATCFCGNGKKYRKCHRPAYKSIKKIGQERLERIISNI